MRGGRGTRKFSFWDTSLTPELVELRIDPALSGEWGALKAVQAIGKGASSRRVLEKVGFSVVERRLADGIEEDVLRRAAP